MQNLFRLPHFPRPLVYQRLLWLLLWAALPAACAAPSPPVGSCTLQLPSTATDEQAIAAVVHAEGELVVAQKIDALMALWADGAYIANAKNTPDNPADDQFWRDKDAIRHRYVRTVFPGAPKAANPADLKIKIQGDQADVHSTTHIGNEISPAGDHWVLVRQGGCWVIESLTYNLEPQP